MKISQKILILIIITLVIIGVISAFVVYPSLKDIKDITWQIYSVRKDLEIKYQRGQNIKKTTSNLREIEPSLPKLSSFYIKENEELEFITTLEEIAQRYSVEQNIGLNFPNKESAGQMITVPLTLQLSGNYIDTLKYLSALEQLDYYININNLAFRAKDSVKGPDNAMINGQVTVMLTGEVYWLIGS